MAKTELEMNADIKELIETSEYIFFDIFDTLITRPFANPKGLFSYMEYTYNLPGFYTARVQAEQQARTRQEEVSLEDIYDHIHPVFKNLKNIESKCEIDLCYAIPENYKLFQYCLQKKKIIHFISDMYLTQNTILKILRKNGYEATNRNLYLSSQINHTKRTGSIYDFILDKLQISQPSKALMIGDNYESDVLIPRKKGMQSYHIKSKYSPEKYLKKLQKTLGPENTLSSLVKIVTEPHQRIANYWQKIGFNIAGPLVYSYIKFINSIINHYFQNKRSVKILFAGRDGYLLNKSFALLNKDIASEYIYAPRKLLAKINIQSKQTPNPLDSALNKLFSEGSKNLECYRTYLEPLIKNFDDLIIVDSRSISFSAQKLIQLVTNKKTTGIYWEINSKAKQKDLFRYFEFKNQPSSITVWRLFEFLITSPEPPIKGISERLTPIYQHSKFEENRSVIFNQIEYGCTLFVQTLLSRFPEHNSPDISYEAIVKYINTFLQTPAQQDIIEFRNAFLAVDENHENYIQFLSTSRSNKGIKTYLKTIGQCFWLTIPQRIILNLTHPLRIHIEKKQKSLSFSIFPKLTHNVFLISLRLRLFQLIFSIGPNTNYRQEA